MESFSDYIIFKHAIKHNCKKCKKILQNTKLCAVVKANAYGIGIENVVCQIDTLCDFYAVACFKEAKELRELTDKPILILNFTHISNIEFCLNNNISITISSLYQLKDTIKFLNHSNIQNENKLKIHFAINTGMNRIGFGDLNEFYKAVLFLSENKYLKLEGVYTHFYNAENLNKTEQQNNVFMKYLNVLKLQINLNSLIIHVSNSFASLRYKQFRYNMVRIGIALYGGLESSNLPKEFKSTISIKSHIISLNNVKRGENIGYSKSYVAKRNITVATIPLGYADGIFREFSHKGKVLICGKKCKVIGNICMDMFMVDVTGLKAKRFDEVILIGKDKLGNKITLNEFAKYCNTISYEVLTNIKKNRLNLKFN